MATSTAPFIPTSGLASGPTFATPPFQDAALARVWNYWFAHRKLSPALAPAADPYADDYELAQVLWFRGGPEIDDEIRQQFAGLVDAAARGELDAWRATPRGCVGLVLLLDQFPRNMDRGTARAFAHDPTALAIARAALDRGFDRDLAPAESLFLHLALIHAEDLADARRGLDGITELATRCARRHQKTARSWRVGAMKHIDLLERFGRYPYRNAALGRASTPAEEAFLARPEFTAMFMRSQTVPVAAPAPVAAPQVRSGRPRLRILALHGFRQNGGVFRARLRKLRVALDDIAELVFPTSPMVYTPTGDTRDATVAAFGEVPDYPDQRVWWLSSEDNAEYAGFDASVAYLENVVRAQGPFDGVMGFAQGGTLAAVLAAMQPHPVFAFQFAICISAFPARADALARYVQRGTVKLPAMHVLGLNDILVTPDRSLRLFEVFEPATAKLIKHAGGHFVPGAWPHGEICAFASQFTARQAGDPTSSTDDAREAAGDAVYRAVCDALTAHAAFDVERVRAQLAELAGLGRWSELQSVATLAFSLRAKAGDAAALVAVHDTIVALLADQLRQDVRAAASLQTYCAEGPGSERARRLFAVLAGEPVAEPTAEAAETAVDRELPEAARWPSACPRLAPRIGSRTDRICRLAKDVARAMFPPGDMRAFIVAAEASKPAVAPVIAPAIEPGADDDRSGPRNRRLDRAHDLEAQAKHLAYQRYSQLLTLIGGVVRELHPDHAAEQIRRLRQARVLSPATIAQLRSQPISSHVSEPEPMPVTPCSLDELEPLLVHLRTDAPVAQQTAFHKGTLTPDGRLDLCKQVVGPDGIGPLLGAMKLSHQVKRLLLGNNIVGDGGAAAIAGFIRERADSPLDCWYIAGNQIGPAGVAHVCDALAHDTKVTSLWLKRNPLKADGMRPLAELLRTNRTIEVLDLVNCGLLDDGLAILLGALRGPGANRTLKHLYVGTNGVTERSAPVIAELLADDCRLESLYLSCNRLGDAGVAELARGLSANRTLQRVSLASNRIGPAGAAALAAALADHPTIALVDLGFTKATNSVGELGNFIGDDGARVLAEMLAGNRTLRVLDLLHNFISQVGVNHLRRALEVNRTLTSLQLTQFGRVHNEPGKEEIRAALERNRRLVPADQRDQVSKIEFPDHVLEIYSVYRTKS
jgi:uncharacterized protein (DUF924 family)/Ran GTPase-activating protein (RanGAP) involved in mRNA processing and transport